MVPLHHVPWLVTLFLALLFLKNFPLQIKADDSPSQLVEDVCNRTINATFCVQTFGSDPRSSTASGIVMLAKIAVELAIKRANESTVHLDDMLNSQETKPEFKPAIEQCLHWYNGMYDSYSSASLELEDDEFMTASYDVAITKDDVANCEKFMVQNGAQIESIAAMNQISKYFTSITTVAINMIGGDG